MTNEEREAIRDFAEYRKNYSKQARNVLKLDAELTRVEQERDEARSLVAYYRQEEKYLKSHYRLLDCAHEEFGGSHMTADEIIDAINDELESRDT